MKLQIHPKRLKLAQFTVDKNRSLSTLFELLYFQDSMFLFVIAVRAAS